MARRVPDIEAIRLRLLDPKAPVPKNDEFRILAQSSVSDRINVLTEYLLDHRHSLASRVSCARALAATGTSAAAAGLRRALNDNFSSVRAIAALGLAQLGTAEDLEHLTSASAALEGKDAIRARFATLLLSARLGIKGSARITPPVTVPLRGPAALTSRPFEVGPATGSDANALARFVEEHGIDLPIAGGLSVRCPHAAWVVAVNSDLVREGSAARLRSAPAVMACAGGYDSEIGNYGIDLWFLSQPDDDIINITAFTAGGLAAYAGHARWEASALHFVLETAANAGLMPIALAGTIDETGVRVSESGIAVRAARRAGSTAPER